MQLTITNEAYRETIFDDIRKIPKFPYRIIYEPIKQMKTKDQLGFIFGGLFNVLRVYFYETQGETWTVDDIKTMLYHEVGIFQTKQYPNGMEYTNPITLSVMDKDQASEFISKVINWIESLDPVCILPPDLRNCWLLHVSEDDNEEIKHFNFPERDEYYLRYQRTLSCLYSGKYGYIDAHHVREEHYAGLSQKPPDWFTIPLLHEYHMLGHTQGFKDIINGLHLYGFDIETYCKLAYMRWYNKT